MLVSPDFPNTTTDSDGLRPSVPIVLADDYLYSTLVRRSGRRTSLNPAHVHFAYGPLSAQPAVRGTLVDAPA
jgi:hypothetical protein